MRLPVLAATAVAVLAFSFKFIGGRDQPAQSQLGNAQQSNGIEGRLNSEN
jgi:hypothetical protein